MEVSLNVPVADWYRNTTENNLNYWGLDYPPLSGYASWLFGKFVQAVEPKAVRLHSSRGFESSSSRIAMRFTVLLGDMIVFFPALLFISQCHYKYPGSVHEAAVVASRKLLAVIAFCITLPSLILIDHGHFQYNGVSLGFFLLSVALFMRQKDALGAASFCLSIYFKHMGLYYGLAVFSCLASRLVNILRKRGLANAVIFASKVFLSIILTSLISFWPWMLDKELLIQVLDRLFPLSRGLFEDKVANVWCSISVLVKLKHLVEPDLLFKFCASITVLASLPFCVAVAMRPSSECFLLSTSGCALSAYLFSYQVHEKQILIPLMPLCIMYGKYPLLSAWASVVATFSMFPLLLREGLLLPYVATLAIHLATVSSTCDLNNTSRKRYVVPLVRLGFVVGLILHIALICGKPPKLAPDIFVLLNTGYACAHLCLIYTVMVYLVWTETTSQSPENFVPEAPAEVSNNKNAME